MTDRCSTRCDHDSQCTLLAGHGDRHETDHGCICYDPRQATRAEIIDAWKAANSDAVDRVAAYEEVLTTRREHERRADDRLNDALSGEADAVRRAESAELGCEIAYRREPTQAEGDAHGRVLRHDGRLDRTPVPCLRSLGLGRAYCLRQMRGSRGARRHGARMSSCNATNEKWRT